MSGVILTCTAIKPGKQGIITPDASGYYTIPLGGINCYNSAGQFYDAPDSVLRLFDDSSDLQRRIRAGRLFAENGHPVPEPGMSEEAFLMRARNIPENRHCGHIKEVWLDNTSFKADNGAPIIGIMGKVKPDGELAHVLKSSFENRFADTCFSIRGFTVERWVGRVKYKSLIDIITWDKVGEPGISHACKYQSPALEGYTFESYGEVFSRTIADETIKRAQEMSRVSTTFATESARLDLDRFANICDGINPGFNRRESIIARI